MKEKEKINWGILVFLLVFCGCLKLGMCLDLNEHPYPNNLHTYQRTISMPVSICGNELFGPPYNRDMNDSIINVIIKTDTIIFDGDIR